MGPSTALLLLGCVACIAATIIILLAISSGALRGRDVRPRELGGIGLAMGMLGILSVALSFLV